VAEKIPIVGSFVSPIPHLSDVSESEFAELKVAARPDKGKSAQIALALSTEDIFAPSVYVAGSLPMDIAFDVLVVGVPDTLLNHTEYTGRYQLNVHDRLGKSPAFRHGDGKGLPRGEYVVYVTDSPRQSPEAKQFLASLPPAPTVKLAPEIAMGKKLVAVKKYFLGGKSDASYASRLREYHNKLQESAKHELEELAQFISSLDSQYNSTTTAYQRLNRPKLTPSIKKTWNEFHEKWVKFGNGLAEKYSKWTPEFVKEEDYFYGKLYLLTHDAGDKLTQLHELHHSIFAGPVDHATFDPKLAQLTVAAQTAVSQAKQKLAAAEQMKPTPNGMPQKPEDL
jgi:hypothetical protein